MLKTQSLTSKSKSLATQRVLSYIPRYIISVVVALLVLIPLVTAVLGGFKTNGELQNAPFSLPQVFHWENYTNILAGKTSGDKFSTVLL